MDTLIHRIKNENTKQNKEAAKEERRINGIRTPQRKKRKRATSPQSFIPAGSIKSGTGVLKDEFFKKMK